MCGVRAGGRLPFVREGTGIERRGGGGGGGGGGG